MCLSGHCQAVLWGHGGRLEKIGNLLLWERLGLRTLELICALYFPVLKHKHALCNVCRSCCQAVMLSTWKCASSLLLLSDCIIAFGEIKLGFAQCLIIYARISYA